MLEWPKTFFIGETRPDMSLGVNSLQDWNSRNTDGFTQAILLNFFFLQRQKPTSQSPWVNWIFFLHRFIYLWLYCHILFSRALFCVHVLCKKFTKAFLTLLKLPFCMLFSYARPSNHSSGKKIRVLCLAHLVYKSCGFSCHSLFLTI
jgi:hypothetical protein